MNDCQLSLEELDSNSPQKHNLLMHLHLSYHRLHFQKVYRAGLCVY